LSAWSRRAHIEWREPHHVCAAILPKCLEGRAALIGTCCRDAASITVSVGAAFVVHGLGLRAQGLNVAGPGGGGQGEQAGGAEGPHLGFPAEQPARAGEGWCFGEGLVFGEAKNLESVVRKGSLGDCPCPGKLPVPAGLTWLLVERAVHHSARDQLNWTHRKYQSLILEIFLK
jgi:hypothetical protein